MHLHPALLAFLVVVLLIGAVFNIMLVGAILGCKKIRTKRNLFGLSLGIADCIITIYIMPVGLFAWTYGAQSIQGRLNMCSINAVLVVTSLSAIVLSILGIALERYFSICTTKTTYNAYFSRTWIIRYIILIWIYSLFWAIHGFTGWTRYTGTESRSVSGDDDDSSNASSSPVDHHSGHDDHHVQDDQLGHVNVHEVHLCAIDIMASISYNITMSVCVQFIPLVLVTLCYGAIYRIVDKTSKTLQSHTQQITLTTNSESASNNNNQAANRKSQLKDKRILVVLSLLVGSFIVFWSPSCLVSLVVAEINVPEAIVILTTWLSFFSGSANGAIYVLTNHNIRRYYTGIYHKHLKTKGISFSGRSYTVSSE